jgi:hypothetical protein
VNVSDEARHEPGGSAWLERWTFEAWDKDATFGAIAAITLAPAAQHAWYWASVVRDGHSLLTLVDTELHIPKSSLALRGPALWADHVCETPLEHWTVANEAYGVALDDPEEALGAQRGDLVPLGFDLEWEAADDPIELADGYTIAATVNGEILIADETVGVAAGGRWHHEWGELRWPGVPAHPPHGPRAPLRIDPPSGDVILVERVLTPDGWHEWLRPERAP